MQVCKVNLVFCEHALTLGFVAEKKEHCPHRKLGCNRPQTLEGDKEFYKKLHAR